jgi:predicted MFS family arabinose efflux permease
MPPLSGAYSFPANINELDVLMRPVRIMPFIVTSLFGLYTMEFGVVGILPFVMQRYDVTIAEAGALLGLFALTVAIVGPFAVLISSRFDRRMVLIVSLAMFSICSVLSAFAPSFGWLIAYRTISAVFHPMFYAAALSTAISLYPPDRAGKAVSNAVFGSNLGLVAGVPLMSFVAATTSYRMAFLFCGAITFAACVGLFFSLPPSRPDHASGVGNQVSILKKPALWLNLATAVFITGALFCVYSYAAEYFSVAVPKGSAFLGLSLTLFGLGGVAGNMLIGRFLDGHLVGAILLQPVLIIATFCVLAAAIGSSWGTIDTIALFWGAVHTSGMVTSQMWVRSVSREAPDFATSLYITAANAGVLLGSSMGGFYIVLFDGIGGAILCGGACAFLALISAIAKILIYGRHGSRNEALTVAGAECSGR